MTYPVRVRKEVIIAMMYLVRINQSVSFQSLLFVTSFFYYANTALRCCSCIYMLLFLWWFVSSNKLWLYWWEPCCQFDIHPWSCRGQKTNVYSRDDNKSSKCMHFVNKSMLLMTERSEIKKHSYPKHCTDSMAYQIHFEMCGKIFVSA